MRKLSFRNPLNSNIETASLREGTYDRHLFMSCGVHSCWQSSGKPHKQSSASAPGGTCRHLAARVERNSKVFSNLKCQRTLRCAELSHHLERCVDFHVWAGVRLLSIVTRLLLKTFGQTIFLAVYTGCEGVKLRNLSTLIRSLRKTSAIPLAASSVRSGSSSCNSESATTERMQSKESAPSQIGHVHFFDVKPVVARA